MKHDLRYGGTLCGKEEEEAIIKSLKKSIKNKGQFVKGHGKIGDCGAPKGSHNSPSTEFKKGQMAGANNVNWKGDKAGYVAKHMWIASERGKPDYCEHCKRSDLPHRHYQWANISGKYKREASDWLRLCAKCHRAYDKANKLRKNLI